MLRERLRTRFDAAVKKAGLAEHRDTLLADARECVLLHYGEPVEQLPLGASRVGGTPDLPASVEWPDGLHEGKPYGKAKFLAQFNLAELPAVDDVGLPRHGHLWFFVRDTSLCDLPVDVLYRDGSEPLAPRKKPATGDAAPRYGWRDLKMAPLTFSVGISLPFSGKAFNRKWRPQSGKLGALSEALGGDLDSYGPRDGLDGRIGGCSYQADHDLARQIAIEQLGKPECIYADAWETVAQLDDQIARGLPWGNEETYRRHLKEKRPHLQWIEENEAGIAATAASVRLLCMFRPNGSIGLEFGDGMFLDFFINDSALANRDFRDVRCLLPMLL